MRADRLLSLVLLLQARGGTTARALAAELGVSVRTVYRDLGALGAAGVPVITESGPGGGCRLMDGYRFPLRGLRPEEAEALLILGVPAALRELGLAGALTAAHRQIQVTAGLAAATLVHLDMPRWFGGQQEEAPCLRELAQALRLGRKLALEYRSAEGRDGRPRVVGPLGLVNKAGTWYLVATPEPGEIRVFQAGRGLSARVLPEAFGRPADFELAGFWARWSAEFEASRPRLQVRLKASPQALAWIPEVFGPAAGPALEAAAPPGEDGWRVVTLSFEHERAAVHRLAGFGDQVGVLDPLSVRAGLQAIAYEILRGYDA
jgi:predicted DNA-binding transcriptional regulator YafY